MPGSAGGGFPHVRIPRLKFCGSILQTQVRRGWPLIFMAWSSVGVIYGGKPIVRLLEVVRPASPPVLPMALTLSFIDPTLTQISGHPLSVSGQGG